MGKGSLAHRINYLMFQKNLMNAKPNSLEVPRRCARYLYICEDGLVHYCSQQRGHPGIPLLDYGRADIEREYRSEKALRAVSAPSPASTRRVSWMRGARRSGRWRERL